MKLIVVEDEKIIRTGLLKHVPWQRLGVSEVEAAANGEEALTKTENFRPDIVLSDIRMPGMSGVDLCRKLREKFPEIEIIFSTGYADKEYLKAAIDLHAVGYVEKPVNVKLLSENVEEAVQRVRERRKSERAKLRNYLLEVDTDVSLEQAEGAYFRIVMIHFDSEGCGAGFLPKFEKTAKEALRPYRISITMTLFDPFCLILLLGSEKEKRWKEMEPILVATLKSCTQDGSILGCFLSHGRRGSCQKDILLSYRQAKEAGKALSWLGWGKSVCYDDIPPEKPWMDDAKKQRDEFYQLLIDNNEKGACLFQEELYEKLVSHHLCMSSDIRYHYCVMRDMLEKAAEYRYPGMLEKPWEQGGTDFFMQAETFAEMKEEMIRRIEQLFEKQNGKTNTHKTENRYNVSRITEYIQEHYADQDLSIGTLAELVYLTPTYLSTVFKKQTGLTIGQYLLEVRVENAKQKMRDPQLKFYQVSEMVGYEDANYFAKIFKKKTGVTPTEYKESLQMR